MRWDALLRCHPHHSCQDGYRACSNVRLRRRERRGRAPTGPCRRGGGPHPPGCSAPATIPGTSPSDVRGRPGRPSGPGRSAKRSTSPTSTSSTQSTRRCWCQRPTNCITPGRSARTSANTACRSGTVSAGPPKPTLVLPLPCRRLPTSPTRPPDRRTATHRAWHRPARPNAAPLTKPSPYSSSIN